LLFWDSPRTPSTRGLIFFLISSRRGAEDAEGGDAPCMRCQLLCCSHLPYLHTLLQRAPRIDGISSPHKARQADTIPAAGKVPLVYHWVLAHSACQRGSCVSLLTRRVACVQIFTSIPIARLLRNESTRHPDQVLAHPRLGQDCLHQ
jgi:hypothetical protein